MAQRDLGKTKRLLAEAWTKHQGQIKLVKLSPGRYVLLDEVINPPRGLILFRAQDFIKGADLIFQRGTPAPSSIISMLDQPEEETGFARRDLTFQEVLERIGLAPNNNEIAAVSVRRFEESLNDPVLVARLPREEMIRAERKRFSDQGLDVLLNLVNREALQALSLAEGIDERDYNFYAASGEVGEVRRQAAAAYPLLAPLFSRRISLEDAIDAKESLVDAVERAFTPPQAPGETAAPTPRISKAAMGRLRGISFPAYGLGPEFIARVMTELPPDWFPKNGVGLREEDWIAFTDLASAAVERLVPLTGSALPTLMESCAGKWEAFRDRVVRGFTDSRPPAGANDAIAQVMKDEVPWAALRELPKRKIPAAAGEIAKRMFANGGASEAADMEGRRFGDVTEEALADWIVRLEAPPNDRNTIIAACAEVEIIADMFARKVLLPLANHVISPAVPVLAYDQLVLARNIAGRILFGGKSMVAIAEIVREFRSVIALVAAAGPEMTDIEQEEAAKRREIMRQQEAKERAISILGVDMSIAPGPGDWAPLTDIVQAPNGLWIVPITSDALVSEEGSGPTYAHRSRKNPDGSLGLDLCLGNPQHRQYYVKQCQQDGAHLLSVRRAANPSRGEEVFERLATAFITRVSIRTQKIDVNQFMAKSNTTPSEEARYAFEWYKAGVINGNIPLKPASGLDVAYNNVQAFKRIDEVRDACGYQWRDPNCIKRAMFTWGKFVPKKMRQLGFEGFKAAPEMVELIEFLEPGTHRRLSLMNTISPLPA